MKLPSFSLVQLGAAFVVALIPAISVRFALGLAGWLDLGGLLIATAMVFGLTVLAERRAKEARAAAGDVDLAGDVEQLKAKVARLLIAAGFQ